MTGESVVAPSATTSLGKMKEKENRRNRDYDFGERRREQVTLKKKNQYGSEAARESASTRGRGRIWPKGRRINE